jgi:hypothetical protein
MEDDDHPFKIMGKYIGLAPEEIDVAQTREEADYLLGEYKLAYGRDWQLWIEEKGEDVLRWNPDSDSAVSKEIAILKFLLENGPASMEEIRQHLQSIDTKWWKEPKYHMTRLKRRGFIDNSKEKVVSDKVGKYFVFSWKVLWFITSEGKTFLSEQNPSSRCYKCGCYRRNPEQSFRKNISDEELEYLKQQVLLGDSDALFQLYGSVPQAVIKVAAILGQAAAEDLEPYSALISPDEGGPSLVERANDIFGVTDELEDQEKARILFPLIINTVEQLRGYCQAHFLENFEETEEYILGPNWVIRNRREPYAYWTEDDRWDFRESARVFADSERVGYTASLPFAGEWEVADMPPLNLNGLFADILGTLKQAAVEYTGVPETLIPEAEIAPGHSLGITTENTGYRLRVFASVLGRMARETDDEFNIYQPFYYLFISLDVALNLMSFFWEDLEDMPEYRSLMSMRRLWREVDRFISPEVLDRNQLAIALLVGYN